MRWRRTVVVLLPVLLVASGLVSLRRYWRSSHSVQAVEHQARLDTRIPELNWNDLSLDAAVEQLRRATRARIRISDQVSSNVPGPNGPVPLRFNIHLRDAKLAMVLDILTDAAVTGMYGRTTWDLRPDGTILILPESAARRIVRVYDVRDLLAEPAGPTTAADALELAIRTVSDQAPLPVLKSSGRWTFVGTRQEQAAIAAALDSLRRPWAALDQSDQTADALDRMVGPVHRHHVPLATVIEALAAQARVNIVVDWPGSPQFRSVADPRAPVTVDLERLPLRTAINLIFNDRMTFSANDNALYLSPPAPPISFRQVRAYDLSDLIAVFARRLYALDAQLARGAHAAAPEYYREEAIDLLEELAQRSASSGTRWFRGSYGHGRWLNGRLIVAGPSGVQMEMRRIFEALRQFVQESQQHSPAKPRFLSRGQNVFALLNSPVKEISLDHAPLVTAMARLQSAAGITIAPDAFFAGVARQHTRPVTLHLWNVPLSVALHQILNTASDTTPLSYGINDDVILIGSEPQFLSVTRV